MRADVEKTSSPAGANRRTCAALGSSAVDKPPPSVRSVPPSVGDKPPSGEKPGAQPVREPVVSKQVPNNSMGPPKSVPNRKPKN